MAAENGAGVQFSWTTLLFGYGPLGVFAVMVGIDKVGNNSERNRLRDQLVEKDNHIKELHNKVETDVVPALLSSVASNNEGAKALAEAIDVIREYTDPPRSSSNRSRRGD